MTIRVNAREGTVWRLERRTPSRQPLFDPKTSGFMLPMHGSTEFVDTGSKTLLVGPGKETSIKGKGGATFFIQGQEKGGAYLYVALGGQAESHLLPPGHQHEYFNERIVLEGLIQALLEE